MKLYLKLKAWTLLFGVCCCCCLFLWKRGSFTDLQGLKTLWQHQSHRHLMSCFLSCFIYCDSKKKLFWQKKKKLKNDRKALCENWSMRKEKARAEAGMGDRSQRRKPTVLHFRQVTSKFCCNSAAIWSCLGIFENYWCLHGTFRLSNLINMGTIWTLRYQFLGGSNM